jgi:hypothetical protein
MNRKFLFLLAAGIFAALQACSGDVVEANNPVNTSGALKVRVTDASTDLPLEGATVTVTTEAGSKPATTNGLGIAEFPNISVGSHKVLSEKTGYAKTLKDVNLSGDAGGNVYITNDEVEGVTLYPLTAKAKGFLFYQDKDGNVVPADGFEVIFTATNYVFDFADTAIVGATGAYAFENLPAVDRGFKLTVPAREKDGWLYPEMIDYGYSFYPAVRLINEDVAEFTTQTVTGTQIAFALIGCSNRIAPTASIACSFTDEIDNDKFKSSMVSIGSQIYTTAISGKTITFAPIAGSEWYGSLSSQTFSFQISFNGLLSKNGNEINTNTPSIIIVREVPNLEALTISNLAPTATSYNGSETYAELTWTPVAGATANMGITYKLYFSEDGGEYKNCGSTTSNDPAATALTTNCSFDSALGTSTITIIAQAENANNFSKTAFSNTVTVKATP